MSRFFRFPRTPHLRWLAQAPLRDEKQLAPEEVAELLSGEVVVEEKLDGSNVGLSRGDGGRVRAQHRGAYLERGRAHPEYAPLWPWIATREAALASALGDDLMLFGEWCFAVHSVAYDRLPDWLLFFDVYDRSAERFWSVARRDALLERLGLARVPELLRGPLRLEDAEGLLGRSRVGSSPMEGIVVRRDAGDFGVARAKLVRAEFALAIEEHWASRPITRNRLAG